MQNHAKQCKKGFFEDIEFQEIEEKRPFFGESGGEAGLPARTVEWQIPELGKTIEEESRKFRIYPNAVLIGQAIGQAIGYVIVLVLSVLGQAAWFLVLVLASVLLQVLCSLTLVLASVWGYVLESLSGQGQRQGQDIDWRDVPTGWERTGKHVRQSGQGKGHINNVNINVNITNH